MVVHERLNTVEPIFLAVRHIEVHVTLPYLGFSKDLGRTVCPPQVGRKIIYRAWRHDGGNGLPRTRAASRIDIPAFKS
jgi:hypothetical protein